MAKFEINWWFRFLDAEKKKKKIKIVVYLSITNYLLVLVTMLQVTSVEWCMALPPNGTLTKKNAKNKLKFNSK